MVKISRFFLVFVLIAAWLFSGWPQIFNFPPETQQARASQVTLAPTAVNTSCDAWSLGNGADKVSAVQTNDGDTSWIKGGGNNNKQTYEFPNAGIPAGSTVNFVEIFVVHMSDDGSQTSSGDFVRTWDANGCVNTALSGFTSPVGSYTTDSFQMTQDPETSVAWTDTEVNNWSDGSRTFGVRRTSGPREIRVTQIYVVVDYTSLATTFLIGGTETGTKDTAVTTITFPEGSPAATITVPYNDVDGSGDPQVLHATVSEPVVKIKNTHASQTYNVVLEITTWTNNIVDMEYYNLATDGATNIETVTAELSNANGAARTVSTGVSIAAGTYKDLYLKLVLGSVAGKTGTSTLTILGEVP